MNTKTYRALLASFFVLGLLGAGLSARAEIRVYGRLVDAQDAGVAGALVRLEDLPPTYGRVDLRYSGRLAGDLVVTAKTDAAGYYELIVPEPGRYKVVLAPPGHLAMQYLLRPIYRSGELPPAVLTPAVDFKLEVVDPKGLAAAVAGVAVYTSGESKGWWPQIRLARTDQDGIAVLPRGQDEEIAIQVLALGYPLALVGAEESGAGKTGMKLDLKRGVSGKVRAVDGAGKSLSNALVYQAGGSLPLARTDADGLASIVLAPASQEPPTLRAVTADGLSGRADLRFDGPRPSPKDAGAFVLKLAPLPRLAGRLIDGSTGDPLPGAKVWAKGRGDVVTSDRHGDFEIPAPTHARLQAIADGYALGQTVFRGGEEQYGLLTLMPAATVRGQVVDDQGEGVSGVDIRSLPSLSTYDDQVTTTSSRSGRFELAGLLARNHVLLFKKEGFAPLDIELESLEPFEVRAGLRVALSAGGAALGTVLDSGEAPVAGAEVELTAVPPGNRQGWRYNARSRETKRLTAETDARGRFRIPHVPAGDYTLKAAATGFAPATVRELVIEGAGDAELGPVVLVPGASIAGIVLDSAGMPLAGAEIRTRSESSHRGLSLRSAPVTASDAGGHFRIDDFQHGRTVSFLVSAAGFAPQAATAKASESPEPVEVRLEKAGGIRGRVMDADGTPMEQAKLWLNTNRRTEWSRRQTRPDAAGLFEIDDLGPGRVYLIARAPGYTRYELRDLEIVAGETLEGIDVVLEKAVVLVGRFLDSAGRPVPGMVEIAREGQQHPQSSYTDDTGQFRIDSLAPGSYVLIGRDRSHREVEQTIELESGIRLVDLVFKPGWEVSGRVYDASGQSVAEAELRLESAVVTQGMHRRRVYPGATNMSRADGTFVLTDVAPGKYHLSASKAGYASARTSEPIEVDGPLAGIDLELSTGITLTGRVLGLAPEELPQVGITAYGNNQYETERLDLEGRYSIPNLGPGSWIVRAGVGRRQVQEPLEIAEGQSVAIQDLEFVAGYSLNGTFKVAGQPVSDATISIHESEDPHWRMTVSMSEGRFHFEELPAGSYEIRAGTGANFENRWIRLDSDLEITIDITGAEISGRVVDVAGQPIAGAHLLVEQLTPEATADGERVRVPASRRTDSLGRFSLEVRAGDWLLIASKGDYAQTQAQIRVENGVPVEGLELTLKESEGFSFDVVTAAGAVPLFVNVAVFNPDGRRVGGGTYRTEADGRVRVAGVAAGTWDLVVGSEDGGLARRPIQAPGHLGRVVLLATGSLQVTVPELRDSASSFLLLLGPDGQIFDPMWRIRPAISRGGLPFRGTAHLGPLSVGSWTIRVSHSDGRIWKGTATVQAAQTTELTLP